MGWNDKMREGNSVARLGVGEGDDCFREVFAKGNGP